MPIKSHNQNSFYRLLDKLPNPSLRVQQAIAIAVIATQAGISVTGSVVRVTSSGLGCPTWPKCFPGSYVPTTVAMVPFWHQAIEFGNRMLTGVVTIAAGLIVVAVLRARRRREVVFYAWLMPIGTVVQAVLGGITVRMQLLWWTVAIHLIVSMIMIWFATLLYNKVSEPDDAALNLEMPRGLHTLVSLSAVALTATLVVGTMVTGAGPHAGDAAADMHRLNLDIETLAHTHAMLMTAYFTLLIGLGFALATTKATSRVWRRYRFVLVTVAAQALIGFAQYFTGVPPALVTMHVAGATLCVVATASLWATRTAAVPVG